MWSAGPPLRRHQSEPPWSLRGETQHKRRPHVTHWASKDCEHRNTGNAPRWIWTFPPLDVGSYTIWRLFRERSETFKVTLTLTATLHKSHITGIQHLLSKKKLHVQKTFTQKHTALRENRTRRVSGQKTLQKPKWVSLWKHCRCTCVCLVVVQRFFIHLWDLWACWVQNQLSLGVMSMKTDATVLHCRHQPQLFPALLSSPSSPLCGR